MIPPVVDATIEVSHDDGKTWGKGKALLDEQGSWSVPHAIEIARAAWSRLCRRLPPDESPSILIRVIDSAGVVVEQWPKPRS